MAQTIPKLYDLSATGPRTLGLTRRSRYEGPHAHRFNTTNVEAKEEDVDVDAPPQDSSDEDNALISGAKGYGEASDPDSDVSERKPRSTRKPPTKPSRASPRGSLVKMPMSTSEGSQINSQKRKTEQLSDNEDSLRLSFQSSQAGKRKRAAGYGKSRAKPEKIMGHQKEMDAQASVHKKVPSISKGGKSSFIRPPTDNLLAELEKQDVHEAGGKAALNQSSLSSSNRPIFKAPPLSCPAEETQNTKAARQGHHGSLRETRSSRSQQILTELKPLPSDSSKLNVGPAAIAAQKLGIDEVTFKMPSSVSSFPSSIEKHHTGIGLSSPPTTLNDDISSTEFQSALVEEEVLERVLKVKATSENAKRSSCPVCKKPIDSLFLDSFTSNQRMTVREQARFCEAHQRQTAEDEWKAKGYPDIDWSCLHMQVKIHSEAIDEILRGERFSYYRNAYEDFLKREKHRTLQQSLIQGGGIENYSPGYYGSRGARIMIDNLMSNYASKLRRRSSKDVLISARGITSYVRAVLVPELATLLVMDDMNIHAEEARRVLQESVDLGNMLNEEQDEVIKDPEKDDDL